MGAAVGRRLVDHGLRVLTSLSGRSPASEARANAAGMQAVPLERLAEADLILSIVPPAFALPFASQMAPVLEAAERKPLFVDCNAVSPETVLQIARVIEATGAPFVDAGIIGPPPREGGEPSIYASGPHARQLTVLNEHGLNIRVLDSPVGAASALKMCFAGINKGFTAVATAMTLAAVKAGATNELHQELAAREPALLAALAGKVPDMIPKAYRWVAEMQEIANFIAADGAGDIYTGASNVYERIARAISNGGPEINALREFYAAAATRP